MRRTTFVSIKPASSPRLLCFWPGCVKPALGSPKTARRKIRSQSSSPLSDTRGGQRRGGGGPSRCSTLSFPSSSEGEPSSGASCLELAETYAVHSEACSLEQLSSDKFGFNFSRQRHDHG